MPLLLKKEIESCGMLAVWQIQEDNSFFIEQLKLSKKEQHRVDQMPQHRQKEWLVSRYLLDLISEDNQRKEIIKDDCGKPHRFNCKKQIAISHSNEMVAVAIANTRIGIDIQREEAKISNIQHKFISENEFSRIPEFQKEAYYHIFWGAKECMYKAYGKKELKFKVHMHLYPFEYMDQEFEIVGWVRKDNIRQNYILNVRKLENYYLIYSLLQNEN